MTHAQRVIRHIQQNTIKFSDSIFINFYFYSWRLKIIGGLALQSTCPSKSIKELDFFISSFSYNSVNVKGEDEMIKLTTLKPQNRKVLP